MKRKFYFVALMLLVVSCYKPQFEDETTTGKISDIDGNEYNTIKIGSQWWMEENLKTTMYSTDGSLVENVSAYSNAEYNINDYGRLYSFYAVNNDKKLCPTGWHVPSDNEWSLLISFVKNSISKTSPANSIKEAGTKHWKGPNNSTNETGFTALPGGYGNSSGNYSGMGEIAIWWSSTQLNTLPNQTPQAIMVKVNAADSIMIDRSPKTDKYSVRCIKN